jgi:hypothetical protein
LYVLAHFPQYGIAVCDNRINHFDKLRQKKQLGGDRLVSKSQLCSENTPSGLGGNARIRLQRYAENAKCPNDFRGASVGDFVFLGYFLLPANE